MLGQASVIEFRLITFGKMAKGIFWISSNPRRRELPELGFGNIGVFEQSKPVIGEFGGGCLLQEKIALGKR